MKQNFGKWKNRNRCGNYNYRIKGRKMNVKERKFGNARIYSEMTGKRGGCKETDDVEILIMARAWCRYSSVGARVHAHVYTQNAFRCLRRLDSYWYLEEEHRRTINLGDRRLQGRFRGCTRGDGGWGGDVPDPRAGCICI